MFKHCLPLRGVNGESKVNSQRQFIRLFSLIAFAVVSVVGVSNKVDAYGVSPWVDTSGPGGGTVYYYSASGFSCGVSLSQVCNYLEVAGTDWNAQNRFWDSTKSRDVSGTSQEIGTGAKNTSLIVASNSTTGFAATDPDAFVSNSGHGDWFLPSLKEAQNMDNANYSTDFGEVGTSSQVNSSIWYTYDSRTTRTISDSPKREAFKILAVRAFGKSDSSLSGLQVSGEALSPSFNPSVLEYSLTTSQSTVRISPVAVGAKSTLVGSQSVSNGQQSNPIALATGVNQVVLRVTAADGASTTYTVNITKNNSVQYDGNGSTGGSAPGSQTKTNGVALTLTANTGSLVKSGYTFAGWNTQADGLGTSYAVGASYAVEASLTLFAQWSANTLTVTYNSQSGGTIADGSTVTGGAIAASPGSPTRVGYTFTGWFAASSGGSAVSFPYTHARTTDFSLFAQWSVTTYAVTFTGNGSTGGSAPGTQTKTHGVALTLAANTGSLVKSGYTFAGWNTQADGSGTAYAASASYTADAILALFAQWTANTLTVTYNSQSGGTIADGSTVTGGAIAASPGSPTRVGYTFTGWFAASSGGSAVSFPYTHGQTASFSLFAQWIQSSLYGLGSKTKIGTITTADGVGNTFAAETATSSVSLRYPAGGLPAGTVIDIYLVNDLTRAGSLLEREGGFVVSLVVAWVAADGSVPLTVSDKPISMTIANDTIKAGAKTYAIVGGVVILLGTATSNGAVTVLIREDPEIVVVNPSSVTAPVASPGASDEDRPAVVSPVLSPRAPSSKSPSPVANLVPIIPGAPSKISGILKIPKSGTIGAPAVFNPQVNANGQTQRKIITPVQITTVPIDAPPAPLGAKVVPIGSMIVASKETPNQANSRVEIGEAKATFGGQPIVPSIQKSNNGIALLTAGPANIAFAGLSSSSSSTNSENPAGATSPSDGLAASASVPLEIATSSFIASSPVQVWLFSTPLLLAETTVDADGNFSVAIKIPKSLRRGNHTLQIQGFVYTSSGAAEVNANLGISVVEAVESKWSMTFQPYVASISKNNISSWKKFVSSQATPLPNCSITVVSPSKNTTENKKLFQNRQASLFTMLRFNGCIDVAVSKLDKSTKSTALDRTWTVDIYPATRSIDFKWAHDFKTYSANIDRKQVLEWSTLLAESNSSKMICSVIGTEPLTESKANTRLFEARNERIKKYLLSNGCSSVDFGTPISRNEKLASRTIWKVEAKAKS
jgi:uncharacterized repeat protein (TIGR02543 family)